MSDDHHAEQLEKYLREVEGGLDVLHYRNLELMSSEERERTLARWGTGREDREEETQNPTYEFIRRGSGILHPDFWHLPRPKDPKASVRRAVEEDRR